MHVLLLAWCPTSARYVAALGAAGVRLGVLTGPGAPAEGPLADACGSSFELERCRDANAAEVVSTIRRSAVDLVLVAGWPRILRSAFLTAPRLGVVNAHPSLLPHRRGRHPLFWALLRGDREVGITLHRMTEAVDAGPILLQESVAVADDATSASLADAVDAAGAALVPELLELAAGGALPPGRLPTEPGSYDPPVTEGDVRIDWERPASQVRRLVRAAIGTRPAHTEHRGMKLVVDHVAAAPGTPGAPPGTVLAVGDEGIAVAAGDGDAVLVTRWTFCDRPHTGRSLAELVGLAVGSRLGG